MVRLTYALAHPESRTVRRLVRKFGSYRRLVVALTRGRLNSRLLLNKHVVEHPWVIRGLLFYGCNCVVRGQSQSTPLHWAAYSSYFASCQLLLFVSPENLHTIGNSTPLHWASEFNHFAVCELLLRHGEDINKISIYGFTALLWAIERGHIITCETLLRHKADVNIRCDHNSTPLHRAAENGLLEICKLLLRYGADKDAKNSNHKIPYDIVGNNAHLSTTGKNIIRQLLAP